MRSRRVAAIVISLSLVACASAVAAAAAAPSGNAAGLALARAKHRAYARIGAETVKETGFVSMYAVQGASSVFQWRWGVGTVPRGFARATEHVISALHNGKVVWWRDDLVPAPCTSPGVCTREPVEVLVTRAGAFWAFGNAAHHACYGALGGTVPVRIGESWDVVSGRYSAPTGHGSVLVLRHTYPWTRTQTAHSSENVVRATDLDLGGTVRVSKGPSGPTVFTIRYTNTQLAKTPATPRINRCS